MRASVFRSIIARKLADTPVRRALVPIIHEARGTDVEAVAHIERALGR